MGRTDHKTLLNEYELQQHLVPEPESLPLGGAPLLPSPFRACTLLAPIGGATAVRNPSTLSVIFLIGFLSQEQEPARVETPETAAEQQAETAPPPPPPGLLPLKEVAEIDTVGYPGAPLLVHEGLLIVVSREGVVEAYNVQTGAFCWKLGFPGRELLSPRPVPEGLLLSLRRGAVIQVEVLTGKILKETPTPIPLAIAPLPGGTVYHLASFEGEIVAYDPLSGNTLWRASSGEPPAALARGDGLVVVSGARGSLTAMEAGSGEIRWRLRGRGAFAAPAVFDAKGEKLYVGDEAGTFYCVSTKNGKIDYRWETGAAIASPALIEADVVYVVSYANTLFAYRAGSGNELWRVNLPGRPASGPVRVGLRLVVATLDGQIVEVNPFERGRLGSQPYQAPSNIRPAPAFAPPYAALTLYTGGVLLLETGSPPVPAKEQEPTPPPKESMPKR